MSYSTLLTEEVKQSQYLAVIKPRKRITGWALYSGSVYRVAFSLSQYISTVEVNGTSLSLGTSTSLSAGQHILSGGYLYVRLSDSSDPASKYVVATYEIYVSTFEAHFYRDPLDDTTTEVYFEPLIKQPPDIKGKVSEVIFGAMPVQSSTISLSNAEHTFELVVDDSSLNGCDIAVYHWLSENGELKVGNIKKVLTGLCGKTSYSTDSVDIDITDRVDLLSKEWRNDADDSFFSTTLFPNIDPAHIGRPVRHIYGKVQGVQPINVAYVSDDPTTSNNRDWAVCHKIPSPETVYTVQAGCTTTRTYLDTCKGISLGDTLFLDGASDYYVEVTGINYASKYVEHAANLAPMGAGELAKRGFVSRVEIVQDGASYLAFYNRDYTCNVVMSAEVGGFSFRTSLEANTTMPATLRPSDPVFCTVYGAPNTVTKGGIAFGADDSELGCLTDPVVILWDLLKRAGFSEAELNGSSFQSLFVAIGGQSIGMSIPAKLSNEFTVYREIILDVLKSILASLYVDSDLKWKVAKIAPMGAASVTADESAILPNSLKVIYDYTDVLSDVLVEYNQRETGIQNDDNHLRDVVTATSDTAKYVHKVQAQKTFKSRHTKTAEAQALADNLAFVFGERAATYSLAVVSTYFGTELSNVLQVSREKLPGLPYTEGVQQSKTLVVTSVQKGLNKVQLELTDQKGIEENTDGWN